MVFKVQEGSYKLQDLSNEHKSSTAEHRIGFCIQYVPNSCTERINYCSLSDIAIESYKELKAHGSDNIFNTSKEDC